MRRRFSLLASLCLGFCIWLLSPIGSQMASALEGRQQSLSESALRGPSGTGGCGLGFRRKGVECVPLSDAEIRRLMIDKSKDAYSGSCPCPEDRDKRGNRCGRRSAYSRPNGVEPLCYPSQISDAEVEQFRAKMVPPAPLRPVPNIVPSAANIMPTGKDYCLVVGIDNYQDSHWPRLSYARRDAETFADFLRQQGCQVRGLYDSAATKVEIISLAQGLARILSAHDRVLVFLAGHGYTEPLGGQDRGYFVPADGTGDSASHLSVAELWDLSDKMEAARHQLFIVDACFGGLFLGTRGPAPDLHNPDLINELNRRRSRVALTAGGRDQRVLDGGPYGHSFFAGYLLKGLCEGEADLFPDGYVTASELKSYLDQTASNAYQTPAMGTLPQDEGGNFVFKVNKNCRIPLAEPRR